MKHYWMCFTKDRPELGWRLWRSDYAETIPCSNDYTFCIITDLSSALLNQSSTFVNILVEIFEKEQKLNP